MPKDVMSMIENSRIKYKAKLIMREIALLANSLQFSPIICVFAMAGKLLVPFIIRGTQFGSPFHDF